MSGLGKPLYIKYPLDYEGIKQILIRDKKKKLNFFLDLNSITKGFYNAETVFFETNEYVQHKKPSNRLIDELRDYLNKAYTAFKEFDPFFIIFYDNGQCLQNRLLLTTYKESRGPGPLSDEDQHLNEIFKVIRRYYYQEIVRIFSPKKDYCSVQYIQEYETDLVPHFCIRTDSFDSAQPDVMNLILSIDKDLLQTCEYRNVVQFVSSYKRNSEGGYRLNFAYYDRDSALSYIYPKFREGILTAKYVPLVLAIAGDKSDDIVGIRGVGYAKAINLIESNKIGWTIPMIKDNVNLLPEVLKKNISKIVRNMKLISFDEQMKRIPKDFLRS